MRERCSRGLSQMSSQERGFLLSEVVALTSNEQLRELYGTFNTD
jgi:hypothetical protein